MKRDVQGALLVLVSVVVVRMVLSGQYLFYVTEAMGRWLLVSAVILSGLGAWLLWDSRKDTGTAEARDAETHAGETHGGESHGDEGHAHGGPRIAYLLLLPVLAVYVVSPAALGSYSAAKQQAASLPPSEDLGVYPLPAGDPVEVTVRDYVTRAVWDAGRTLEGRTVTMTGFVTPDPDGGWWLGRMAMSCCAADAQAFRVKVDPAPDLPADTWVAVTGEWQPGGSPDNPVPRLAVTDLVQVAQPRNPYQ